MCPICLSCKRSLTWYQNEKDPFTPCYIENCWCGGKIINRSLIDDILRYNRNFRNTLGIMGLCKRLDIQDESKMINYAIAIKILEDEHFKKYVNSKNRDIDPINYFINIIEYVLKRIKT